MTDHQAAPKSIRDIHEELVFIPSSPKISLETRIYHGRGRKKDILIIITHPYGRLGGNLHNNVVQAVYSYFALEGYMTARFNFRGVGNSTGWPTLNGVGEADDVLAVYDYIKNRSNLAPKHVLLCGYSYGSLSTCAVYKSIPNLLGLINISFPAGVMWWLTLGNSSKVVDDLVDSTGVKKLFVIGAQDQFTGTDRFMEFTKKLPKPLEAKVVQSVDHFWGGEEWKS
ncbi:hypothetical protein HDV05_006335 [Chytridiales sp. JEL 0842]|nr:hypothetical protein HDV05_006335 [Chytridiales sp. JEL 0842]